MATVLGDISLVESPSATSVNVPYPAGIRAGEKLIAILAGPSPTAPSVTPSGWTLNDTQTGFDGSSNNALGVWERTATGTETGTVTLTGAGAAGRITGLIFRVNGADATTAFDVTTVSGSGTSAISYTSPSITTATADALLVHLVCVNAGSTSTVTVAPAGLVQLATTTAPDNTTAGRKVHLYSEGRPTAGATGGRSWTQSLATQWSYVVLAFRQAASVSAPAEPTGPVGDWTSVFADDFTGTSLDTTKWTALDSWSMNGVQAMARNVSVSGGNLLLTLESSSFGAAVSSDPFDSGSRYDVQIGDYVEALVYMPGDGSIVYNWPAFWTSGPGWPAAGEHDVAEVLSKQVAINYHYGTSGSPQQSGPWAQAGYWGNAWHVYGVHRKATTADVYWDGRLVRSYATSDNGGGHTVQLNVGVSGTPVITGTASQVRASYVKAWRPTSAVVAASALTYTAEGGTAGATPTIGDTSSGTAFNVVTPGVGTITFDALHAARGAMGLKFATTTAASPLVEWTSTAIGAAVTTDYTRVYGWLPALPTGFTNLIRLYSGTTAVGRLQISSTGTLRYFSDALTTPASLGATTWSLPTGALFRVEMRVIHGAAGSVDLRLFTGANVHGTTPDQTLTITGNTGTNADRVQFGVGANNTLANYTIYLDEFGWSSGGWLGPAPASGGLTYESTVFEDNPKAFIVGQAGGGMVDRVAGRAVTISGTPTVTTGPDGLPALKFDGGAYAQLADDNAFSVSTSGILTIEAWIRPDVSNFPGAEVDTNPDPATREGDYTHWIGKGRYSPMETEWAGRMYSRDRAGTNFVRANRISGYAFPPGGGLGAGSYFQDTVTPGEWIHWALVIDTVNLGGDGWGTTTLYKNGVQRDQDTLGAPYNIVPSNTASPLFIGAAMGSYFTGVVDRIAIYDYKLSQTRIAAHTSAMTALQASSGQRAAVDSAGATDTAARTLTAARSASDSAGATDAHSWSLGRVWAATSSAGATDSVSRSMVVVRAFEDWAPVTDTVKWSIDRPDIQDYQFVFDTEPWVPFGLGQTVVVENFSPGAAELRSQDVLSPTQDVRWFGTDRRTPPTWTFDLYTDVEDAAQALGWAQNMEELWDAEELRSTPNAVLPLRYKIAGRIRRVYGRPGNFEVIPSYVRTGRVHMAADFRLAEHTYYDDTEDKITIRTIPSNTSASGFTFPITFPLTIGAQGDSPYIEQAVVRGKRPTWTDVTFYGPSLDPWVMIGGQRWQLRGELGAQESIRMSGKPWQQGLLRNDGAWMAGMLGPQARLSQLRLKPGNYPVKYGAYDPTGTSRAEVAWHAAYGTM